MALMARYPDNYFDLAIVDPPYGKRPTRENKMGVKKNQFNTKDDLWDIKPKKEYFNELFIVSKNEIETLHKGRDFLNMIKHRNKKFDSWEEGTNAFFEAKRIIDKYKLRVK